MSGRFRPVDFALWPEEAQRKLAAAVLTAREPSRGLRVRERVGAWLWRIVRALSLLEAHQW